MQRPGAGWGARQGAVNGRARAGSGAAVQAVRVVGAEGTRRLGTPWTPRAGAGGSRKVPPSPETLWPGCRTEHTNSELPNAAGAALHVLVGSRLVRSPAVLLLCCEDGCELGDGFPGEVCVKEGPGTRLRRRCRAGKSGGFSSSC